MLNLDMVGRLSQDRVTVFGMATAAEWEALVREENRALAAPMELALAPDGYGPSDHASFYAEGIPVLHFFTNTHPEYHRPEDDWDRVNADGLRRVTNLAGRVARRLAGGSGTRVAALTPVERERPAPAGGAPRERGYGPYLGTIPDMSPREGSGLRLTGVREGSPAERAGLRAGDVVVAFGDAEVTDIYTYTYALREHEVGDVVRIVVEREGRRVAVQAVLGERR
jgi:membrane-associated protease RseP (regulator of RpoE activity)